MRILLTSLTFALFTSTVFAERFTDTVHSVDSGQQDEEHLVYLDNGRVIFVDPEEFSIEDFQPGTNLEIEVNEKNRLESVSTLPDEVLFTQEPVTPHRLLEEPTILSSYSEASSIFSGMNRSYYQETECTDRAHVWSYEEWRKYQLVSRKVFMFFTRTYIRRYNYGWWFHVSPYTLVEDEGVIKEYVMDRRFNSSPRSMKTWSDGFIYSKKECPVSTYNYYRANNNGPEHCFHVKSHMYNRLPLHVENEENTGRVRTKFNNSEVNYSYRAFSRRSP